MSVGGRSKAWQPLAPRIRTEPAGGARVGRCTVFEYVAGPSGLTPPEEIVVPFGVREARLEVWGASGGLGSLLGHNNQGGFGGFIAVTFTVRGGMVLQVRVGQAGSSGGDQPRYNGGGAGGKYSTSGSSGGGATDVRLSPFGLNDRIVAAGGGGGGGGWSGVGGDGFGGAGGYPNGEDGDPGNLLGSNDGGGGGTQTDGGTAGVNVSACAVRHDPAEPGSQGQGGSASQQSVSCLGIGSGGGGGGWFGGGGGSVQQAGGGGGSSGFHADAELLDHVTGVWSGNGLARICWV